jgi:hypothetical protein
MFVGVSLTLTNFTIGGVCTRQVLDRSLIVSWVYAGGASVASPAVIWSENTGDAANQIVVEYNGVSAYINKRVGGVSRFAVVLVTLPAGTYPVKITLNSDNTMKLSVNGVESGSGLGTELYADTGFDNAGSWTLAGGTTISASKLNFPNVAIGAYARQGIATVGKVYAVTFNIEAITAGSLTVVTSTATQMSIPKTDTGLLYGARSAASTTLGIRCQATTTATVDTASAKEIYNNTDTTAIPWATVL